MNKKTIYAFLLSIVISLLLQTGDSLALTKSMNYDSRNIDRIKYIKFPYKVFVDDTESYKISASDKEIYIQNTYYDSKKKSYMYKCRESGNKISTKKTESNNSVVISYENSSFDSVITRSLNLSVFKFGEEYIRISQRIVNHNNDRRHSRFIGSDKKGKVITVSLKQSTEHILSAQSGVYAPCEYNMIEMQIPK